MNAGISTPPKPVRITSRDVSLRFVAVVVSRAISWIGCWIICDLLSIDWLIELRGNSHLKNEFSVFDRTSFHARKFRAVVT